MSPSEGINALCSIKHFLNRFDGFVTEVAGFIGIFDPKSNIKN
jgi:hypothetical protein